MVCLMILMLGLCCMVFRVVIRVCEIFLFVVFLFVCAMWL